LCEKKVKQRKSCSKMESTGLVRSGLRFALLFSVLNNAVPGRSQESENGDQGTKFVTRLFPFSISVMMMPATIIHAMPLQRRSLSATTLIRTKATARIAPTEPEQAETE
jgi:hypothetical protein